MEDVLEQEILYLQGTHRAMTFMIQQKHCRNLKKRKAKKGC
jgi:hypothetical protein